MGILLGWIALSFVAGFIGGERTIGFWPALLLSIFLSPLVGLVVALASTKKSTIEFRRRMLENSGNKPIANNQSALADELAKLERSYLEGKITVYDYESQKDNIIRRYK